MQEHQAAQGGPRSRHKGRPVALRRLRRQLPALGIRGLSPWERGLRPVDLRPCSKAKHLPMELRHTRALYGQEAGGCRALLRRHAPGGLRPNNYTFPFLIKACTEASLIRCGVSVHSLVVKNGLESDTYIRSTLIRLYGGGKDLGGARKLFDECSDGDVVSWNSMIDGYVKCGELDLARSVFDRMISRDIISWNTIINGYGLLGDLREARNLFEQMPRRNVVSWNSILAGHAKCGDVDGARKIFGEMPQRDVVSWNAMLACYAQSGRPGEALELFNLMRREKVKPTDATIVSLLSACVHLGALEQGQVIEAYMRDNGIDINTILGTALVDMYGKCGDIRRAEEIFRALEQKDVLAWNTIIAGMSMHGHAREALGVFEEMAANGPAPDDITFVAVLSACSHSGMVDRGRQLLNLMETTYGIDPKVEHYGCLIDLLARAGLLEEALDVIGSMPMAPNPEPGERYSEGAGSTGTSIYVLLSNIYAAARRWDEARKVRQLMDARGVVKSPGVSMLESDGVVHQFVVSDRSHPEADAICEKLSEMCRRLKVEVGYSPTPIR
ncbi:unnamed protein product [Spirodela intermedia]|uniref:Uncharacterized protein n=1 Tax=Spirodela intermedia TaxID=51605 RepID=A0A7I8IDK2_SPIIN|nr:unnamed protein product [Spirodela intermedia]CAA6655739.1 unnamed protein product [Spirodela intermedia]